MKTLKSKVVCEDIHIDDYDKRRHCVKTMEREDLVVSSFFFFNTNPRPSRGAKPHGADDAELPQARPHQAGSRGGGEFMAGYLARCP